MNAENDQDQDMHCEIKEGPADCIKSKRSDLSFGKDEKV